MILNKQIIAQLKEKSGLTFDKSKDFETLCNIICEETGRTIGVTTLKRLFGYISDDRKTNEYTLNTIAVFLEFSSWDDLTSSMRIDSDWNYEENILYVDELTLNSVVRIKYLNRTVSLKVVDHNGIKALLVIGAKNSSLKDGDILFIDHLKEGDCLEAKTVIRGESIGNYRTNGELKEITIEKWLPNDEF